MKIIVIMLLVALNVGRLLAQSNPSVENYINLKNALIKGDPKAASLSAGKLSQALDDKDQALKKTALAIENGKDIANQRETFAILSKLMYQHLKVSNEVKLRLYYTYCPMKKAYWISEEAAIKNPYYGSKMLTCGKVQEIINN